MTTNAPRLYLDLVHRFEALEDFILLGRHVFGQFPAFVWQTADLAAQTVQRVHRQVTHGLIQGPLIERRERLRRERSVVRV